MTWTRTDATEVMDGKYSLHYKTKDAGGKLVLAGRWDTLLEAQAEQARWEAKCPGMQVWVVQHGVFVVIDEEKGRRVQ